MSRAVWIGLAALLLFAGGAAGTVAYLHSIDPVRRADRLAEAGNMRGAQVELRNALRKDPDAAVLHLRMARVQLKLADPVAAEREFRLAISRGGNLGEILPELGEAMLAQGENKQLLAAVPPRGATPDITARNLLVRAIAQLALKDAAAAEATLADARRTVPDSIQALLIAARLAASREDAAGAEAAADVVLARDPAQIDALLLKGQLVAARGDRAGAIEMAARAVASSPYSAMSRISYAGLLMDKGDDAKALAQVDEVLANQPRFLDAVYLRGVLLARAGRLEEAAAELTKLDFAAQRLPQALFAQANIAARLNRMQTASEFARRYHTLVPDDHAGTLVLARAALAIDHAEEARSLLVPAVAAGHRDPETLDLLGKAYAATGDGPAAAAAFDQAVQGAPGDAGLLGDLGLAQMQAGSPGEAAATLSRALAITPNLPTANEALVAAFLELNQPDEAEKALDTLRKTAGTSETVAILGAMVKVRRLDLDGAEAALADVVRTYPASWNARLNLARVLAAQGRQAAALTTLREVLAKDPGNLAVLNTYLQILALNRDLAPAIAALEAARQVRPDNPALAASLGDALVAAGTPDKASAMLRAARGKAPTSIPLLSALARAEGAAKDGDADLTWREVARLAPGNRPAVSALLDTRLQRGDAPGARAVLRDAMAAAPGDLGFMTTAVAVEARLAGTDPALKLADTLRQLPAAAPWAAVLKGDLLMRLGRVPDAVQAYAAEPSSTSFAPLGVRLGVALVRAGNTARAADVLRATLQQAPGNIEAAQLLAQLEIAGGRLPEAQAQLEALLAQAPDNALALNNLAWVYAERGDTRARATAQRAYLQSPGPDAADTLGWIMVKDGDAKAAVPLLRQSSEKRPGQPGVQYHLAVALRDAGQPDAAVKLLEPLVQGPQPFAEKDDARKLLTSIPR